MELLLIFILIVGYLMWTETENDLARLTKEYERLQASYVEELQDFDDLKKLTEEQEKALQHVYNLSHYASTGPAVPDRLWEIREHVVDYI